MSISLGVPDKYWNSSFKLSSKTYKQTTSFKPGENLVIQFSPFDSKFEKFLISNDTHSIYIEKNTDNKLNIILDNEYFDVINQSEYNLDTLTVGFTNENDFILVGLPFFELNDFFQPDDILNITLNVTEPNINLTVFKNNILWLVPFGNYSVASNSCSTRYWLYKHAQVNLLQSYADANNLKYINTSGTSATVLKLLFNNSIDDIHRIDFLNQEYTVVLTDNQYRFNVKKLGPFKNLDIEFVAFLKPLLSRGFLNEQPNAYQFSELDNFPKFGPLDDLVTFTALNLNRLDRLDSSDFPANSIERLLPISISDKPLCDFLNICYKYNEDNYLLTLQSWNTENSIGTVRNNFFNQHLWNNIPLNKILLAFSNFYSYLQLEEKRLYFSVNYGGSGSYSNTGSNKNGDYYFPHSSRLVIPLNKSGIPKELYKNPDSIQLNFEFDFLGIGREHTIDRTGGEAYSHVGSAEYIKSFTTNIPHPNDVGFVVVTLSIVYEQYQIRVSLSVNTASVPAYLTCTDNCLNDNLLCSGRIPDILCFDYTKEFLGICNTIPIYSYYLFDENGNRRLAAYESCGGGSIQLTFNQPFFGISNNQICKVKNQPNIGGTICYNDWYLVVIGSEFNYIYRIYVDASPTCYGFLPQVIEDSNGNPVENYQEYEPQILLLGGIDDECNEDWSTIFNSDTGKYEMCQSVVENVPNLMTWEGIWNE